MPRATPRTLTKSFSWSTGAVDSGADLFHLVICWSLDEPDRIGEAAPVEGRCILGRGTEDAKDPAPRVFFYRKRPESAILAPPLTGVRISRVQLDMKPLDDDRLLVRSVGRCPMIWKGEVKAQAELRPGDTLVLRDALVLLLVRRTASFDALSCYPDPLSFPFGMPDPHGILGESPASWALRDDLALAAQSGKHVLSERREDIPLLVRHLLTRAAQTTPAAQRIFERRGHALVEPRIDPLLIDSLVRHRYTLHVRELERLLWVALASSRERFLALTPELSAELGAAAEAEVAEVEARAPGPSEIEAALSKVHGSVTAAARRLGLKNRFALYRLMKRHGIAASRDEP